MNQRNVYSETAILGEKPTRDRNTRGRTFSAKGDFGVDPITRNLRRVYDEVASEPLPAELKRLLDELDAHETEGDADA